MPRRKPMPGLFYNEESWIPLQDRAMRQKITTIELDDGSDNGGSRRGSGDENGSVLDPYLTPDARHRHDAEANEANTLSERLSGLRIDEGSGGAGGSGPYTDRNQTIPNDDAASNHQAPSRPAVDLSSASPASQRRVEDYLLPSNAAHEEYTSPFFPLAGCSDEGPTPAAQLPRPGTVGRQETSRKSDAGLSVKPEIPTKTIAVLERSDLETAGQKNGRPRRSATGLTSAGSVRNNGNLDSPSLPARSSERSPYRGNSKRKNGQPRPHKPRMLACPYLKHDPATYGQRSSCRGKMYPSIHRLKEHLYRTHKQKKPGCSRCGEIFPSDAERKKHFNAPKACDFVEGVTIEGFDATTELQLKSKKQKPGVVTEEDKWMEIYRILFPGHEVPDPFHNTCLDTPEVERIFTRNVPTQLKKRTYSQMVEAVGFELKEKQKRALMGVCRNFAVEMFQQSRQHDVSDGDLDPDEEQETSVSGDQMQHEKSSVSGRNNDSTFQPVPTHQPNGSGVGHGVVTLPEEEGPPSEGLDLDTLFGFADVGGLWPGLAENNIFETTLLDCANDAAGHSFGAPGPEQPVHYAFEPQSAPLGHPSAAYSVAGDQPQHTNTFTLDPEKRVGVQPEPDNVLDWAALITDLQYENTIYP